MDKLRIEINDFQVISKASVSLDGITILTGDNGSGKSTLSKMLYYSIDYLLQYDKNQYKQLFVLWGFLIERLYSFAKDLSLPVDENFQHLVFDGNYKNSRDYYMSQYNKIKSVYLSSETNLLLEDPKRLLFVAIPSKYLDEVSERINAIISLEQTFNIVDEYLFVIESLCVNSVNTRPSYDFFKAFSQTGLSTVGSENINVFEFGSSIITEKRMNYIYSIENVIYSDFPAFIFSSERVPFVRKERYNYKLASILKEESRFVLDEISQFVFNEISNIIGGVVQSDSTDVNRQFTYVRKSDDIKFDLLDSATGIRQFAILQLLLSKGLMNDKLLLILDEPEAHLHPQWIVEYARMIVLLNKHLGVKFLLATHSPDFINAMRSIAEKNDLIERVQMYLTIKDSDKEQYHFENLGVNVEPIFESFNIALDRIYQYGV